MDLFLRTSGVLAGDSGRPVILFLHGLGAHGEVWSPMTESVRDAWPDWQGCWIAPDLLGHGRSPCTGGYGLADHAAAVADLMRDVTPQFLKRPLEDTEVTVVGHSMGGAVGLELASGRYGFTPSRVLALGVKVAWTADEAAWLNRLALAPAKLFAKREEAIARFLKVSGLEGLTDPHSDVAAKGVTQDRGQSQWRLAADPQTARVGVPPMEQLMGQARCPVRLAAGQHDAMSRIEDLRRWDPAAQLLAGLGHNAMVEAPRAVWDWIAREIRVDGQ